MCLYSKENTPMVAEKDITCYKALWKKWYGYVTPIQKNYVSNEVIKGKRLMKPSIWSRLFGKTENDEKAYETLTLVGTGYIHVYVNKRIAKFCFRDCDIFECVIPKGTEYWVDKNEYVLAARKIRFVEQV